MLDPNVADGGTHPRQQQRLHAIVIFAVGVMLIAVLLLLTFSFPELTPHQYGITKIVLALACAAIATQLDGFLDVRWSGSIRAGGALAVFALVYFFSPADFVVSRRPAPEQAAVIIPIPDPETTSPSDFDEALRKIVGNSERYSNDAIRRISRELTNSLMRTDSKVDRVSRRSMNEAIVSALKRLNNNDFSVIWRNLPERLDLSDNDLSNVNLRGVRFQESFLIYTDFSNAELDDAIFDNAYLRHAIFKDAEVSDATFPESDWFNALDIVASAGVPMRYVSWLECPEVADGSDPFANMKIIFDNWYGVDYDELDNNDLKEIVEAWQEYTKPNGLCSKAGKR